MKGRKAPKELSEGRKVLNTAFNMAKAAAVGSQNQPASPPKQAPVKKKSYSGKNNLVGVAAKIQKLSSP